MPKAKHKMGETVLKEISTVVEGDNPHAHIVFFKTKDSGDKPGKQAGESGESNEGKNMFDVKKKLGLPDTATDEQIEKALGDLQTAAAETETLKKSLETATKANETAEADIAKLKGEKEAVEAEMTKAKGDESFTDIDGETIKKSVVGGSYEQLKKMNDRLLDAEIEKRATTDFSHIAKDAGTITLLRIAKGRPKGDVDVIDAFLKKQNDLIGAAFTKSGRSQVEGDVDAENPEAKIDEMAKARAEKDGISVPAAYDIVTKSAEGQALLRAIRQQ